MGPSDAWRRAASVGQTWCSAAPTAGLGWAWEALSLATQPRSTGYPCAGYNHYDTMVAFSSPLSGVNRV